MSTVSGTVYWLATYNVSQLPDMMAVSKFVEGEHQRSYEW